MYRDLSIRVSGLPGPIILHHLLLRVNIYPQIQDMPKASAKVRDGRRRADKAFEEIRKKLLRVLHFVTYEFVIDNKKRRRFRANPSRFLHDRGRILALSHDTDKNLLIAKSHVTKCKTLKEVVSSFSRRILPERNHRQGKKHINLPSRGKAWLKGSPGWNT